MKTCLKCTGLLLVIFAMAISSCTTTSTGGNDCLDLVGTYKGTFTGSFSGELTLIITESYQDEGRIEGTWSGTDPNTGITYTGKINKIYFDCSNGQLEYEYGLNLSSPMDVLCPSHEDWCYDTGATLGEFEGVINANSGVGTWRADSGAAETVGVTGSGTWSVSKI